MKKFLAVFAVAASLGLTASPDKALDIRPAADVGAVLSGVEWENTNTVALAEATADGILAAFVSDGASARALLAQVKGAYETDSLVARQIGAVSQWVMGPEPSWLFFWRPSPAAGRKIWIQALLAAAEESKDAYVKTFLLDQLRWCGCSCPKVMLRIRKMGETSGDRGVREMSELLLRELQGKSVGL